MQAASFLKLSIAAALATMALKTGAWWVSGSVSLLSDALESLVNLAGAIFGLAMVTLAARPPDAGHPYGHHKAEYFSSGFEGVLIIVAALAIGWAAVDRLLHPAPLEGFGWGLGLSALSALVNGALALAMLRHAHRLRSVALQGDARHLITDVWTTGGVLLGLVAVWATGWQWLDPLVALAVAANILREGWHLLHQAADGLLDPALEPAALARLQAVLATESRDGTHVDHVFTRRAGASSFVELHLHVPAEWTLRRADERRAAIEQAVLQALPGARVSIQLLPLGVEAAAVVASPSASSPADA
jgi:cation diffusion facilitator family transporter